MTSLSNKRLQGDIGEIAALLHYTNEGYAVSIPFGERTRYDLIVDIEGKLLLVQVKTTGYQNDKGDFVVQLRTNGGNYTQKTRVRKITRDECDIVFVVAQDGKNWEIPVDIIEGMSSVTLNNSKDKYLVRDPRELALLV